jgi:hypothetical protein
MTMARFIAIGVSGDSDEWVCDFYDCADEDAAQHFAVNNRFLFDVTIYTPDELRAVAAHCEQKPAEEIRDWMADFEDEETDPADDLGSIDFADEIAAQTALSPEAEA